MDDLDEAMVAAIWHSALNAYEHDGEGERDDEAAIADLMQALRALPTVSDGWEDIATMPVECKSAVLYGWRHGYDDQPEVYMKDDKEVLLLAYQYERDGRRFFASTETYWGSETYYVHATHWKPLGPLPAPPSE